MWHRNHRPRIARTLLGSLVVLSLLVVPHIAAAQSNPIVLENQQPGSGAWNIEWGFAGDDVNNQVKGYASATSVNKGGSINLHVSVNPAQTYTIDVFRMGYYQGLGGRLMQHIGPLNGTKQANCAPQPTTGLIECGWASSYTLNIPTTWTSGVYLAVLTNAASLRNYITFVVRDDSRPAALLFQQPVTTYQAYNDYPYDEATGKSLYSFNSYGPDTAGGLSAAVKVSFDRPYNGDGDANVWGANVLGVEHAFILWLEKSGYDVTYATDIDTHVNPAMLQNYRGVLVPGHDEYWTREMLEGFEAARDAGTNLGFFSANVSYTQIRLEPSTSGIANRVVVCYREAPLDPFPDATRKTVNWRDPPVSHAEQQLIGTMYTSIVQLGGQGLYAPYKVVNSNHWVYAGTGFSNGDTVTGLVGYEADRNDAAYAQPVASPGTFTILSSSPFQGSNSADTQNATIYQAPSGAWVFGAGTINWGFALDAYNPAGGSLADARIQRMTANILDKFIEGTQTGFTLSATPPAQTVDAGASASYALSVTPLAGFSGDVTFSVSGLPSGATAQVAPNPSASTSTLQVNTSTGTPGGSSTLTITGVSGSVSRTATVTLAVTAPDFALNATPSTRSIAPGQSAGYTVNITPVGGFSSSVTLSVGGLPAGATADFSPNPAGSGSALTVTTTGATPGGTSTLTITGVSGALTRVTTVTLEITAPSFTLDVTPAAQSVAQGAGTSYAVSIAPSGGFASNVALSVAGLPSGATAQFNPNPSGEAATLDISTSAATPAGTSTLTITGVSGALTRTTTVNLSVTVPDFALSAAPATLSVVPGGSTSFSIAIGPSGGFAGDVSLAVSGLPEGAGAQFTPNPAGSSATLAVTTSASTPGGTSSLTITGTSGSLTRTTTASLVVTAQDFSFVLEPASRTVVIGDGASYAITLTKINGFSSPVTYSISGLPPDANYEIAPNPATGDGGLFVLAGGATPGGSSVLTITGTSNGITHTATALFNVSSPVDFTPAITPASNTVTQGETTPFSLSMTPAGGFSGAVTYGVTGLPAGAVATISPNPATGTAALSIATAQTTPAASYPLTISAVSGTLSHLLSATLVVSAGSTPPSQHTVTVTAPNTAVSWKASTVQNITYTHDLGAGQPVTIEVSRDGGGSWSTVSNTTTTAATSGSYAWTVTGPPTSQTRIRVSSTAEPAANDISNVNFTITNPTVTVNTPNTAVTWQAGSSKNIKVNHTLASGQPIRIDVSRDGGATWQVLTTMTTTSAASVTYPWTVSGPTATTALIRATWTEDGSVNDVSNVTFNITPSIKVTAPNTAATYGAGSIRTVTWTHNLGAGAPVDIDFSADNGATWSPLASAVASSAATSGTVDLEMPGTVTSLALIRVIPAGTSDLTLGDQSDVAFTLQAPSMTVTTPNTNVNWAAGATQSVKWNHNLGKLEAVKIELARDGVNFNETLQSSLLNSGNTSSTYSWVVTGPATTTAKIRVTAVDDPSVTDISNVTFRIH